MASELPSQGVVAPYWWTADDGWFSSMLNKEQVDVCGQDDEI